MACGDKFLDEVVTGDGYTMANRYGVVAVPGDYTGWRNLARRMLQRLEDRWSEESDMDPPPHEWWNEHVDTMNELRQRTADLPTTFRAGLTGAGITGAIDDAARLIADINCERELVEQRIESLGGVLAPLPGAGAPEPAERPGYLLGAHWGWWLGGGVVLLGGAVAGGYAVATRRRR